MLRQPFTGCIAALLLALLLPRPAGAQAWRPEPPDTSVLEAVAADLPRLHSVLVSWRGELVLERYYNGAGATRPANVKSVSKSVISALVGIALDRGLLPGVREPIATYFPLLAKDADPRKRTITIEDLLTMRSGLESTSNRGYGPWVVSRNWVQYKLARPMRYEPGQVMDYSTGNTHLLSAILTQAAGASTWQFAQEALAGPLGFTLAQWPRDPQGIFFGGNDMLLTPRQMVAFGELYLRGGRANGHTVLPPEWIQQSFVAQGRSGWSGERYGYGWWQRRVGGFDAWYAWGYGGQYIFVVPALDLVVATTSSPTEAEDRRTHRRTVLGLVEDMVRRMGR